MAHRVALGSVIFGASVEAPPTQTGAEHCFSLRILINRFFFKSLEVAQLGGFPS
jgi:hypothetical protein